MKHYIDVQVVCLLFIMKYFQHWFNNIPENRILLAWIDIYIITYPYINDHTLPTGNSV